MPRLHLRPAARLLLVVLGVVVFVLAQRTINATPVPRQFNGWAAVFALNESALSRLFLHMGASAPGGEGTHPKVEYRVAVCGRRDFDGVLILAGDARLRDPTGMLDPLSSRLPHASLQFLHALSSLTIAERGSESHVLVTGVQVFRMRLPAIPCRPLPFEAPPDKPRFTGTAAVFDGRLEGRTMRQGAAALGLKPVRQAQSWPALGQAPMFHPDDFVGFRLGRGLPGTWTRPLRAEFGVDVGGLDGKATVDFARPTPADSEGLSWRSGLPIAAKARVTNSDNLSWWQSWSLASSIWFGIAGGILATLALDAVRSKPVAEPAAPNEVRPARPWAPVDLWVALVLLVFGRRRRSP